MYQQPYVYFVMKTRKLLVLFMTCFNMGLFAQDSLHLKQENYFRYTYDNDFFSATDRYYTQGVRLELILNPLKHNPLTKLLFRVNKEACNYYGLAFERDGFTPRSIRHDSIFYGERPYAGISFLSSFLISVDKSNSQRLSSYLNLGVIGPYSKGAEEQMYIHRKLKNIQPLGWQYQIANDVIINYNIQYEKGLVLKKNVEFIGMLEARAGTLYDDAAIGGTLRFGKFQGYFDDLGVTKNSSNKKFRCYFFLKENVRAVGYNATMQGGVFNKGSVYTIDVGDISRVVGTAYAGFVIAYKRVSIEYSKAYITPEFYGGLSHGWGHCYITVCF